MMTLDPVAASALAPVRTALLGSACADGARAGAEADAEAERILSAARERAAATLARARERGLARAATEVAAGRARTRREARAIVLRARRDAYDTLRRAARSSVLGLTHEPGYATLRDTLVSSARDALGTAAQVRDADGGGVIAEMPGRRIDLSLARFADRAVDACAADIDTGTVAR